MCWGGGGEGGRGRVCFGVGERSSPPSTIAAPVAATALMACLGWVGGGGGGGSRRATLEKEGGVRGFSRAAAAAVTGGCGGGCSGRAGGCKTGGGRWGADRSGLGAELTLISRRGGRGGGYNTPFNRRLGGGGG